MADRRRRSLTALLAAVAALAVVAGDVAAEIERVTVRATVTFEKRGYEFGKLRLEIRRNGVTWRSGPLGSAFILKPQVHVRDLDADGEPEVWLDRYSGGAHCCLDSRFFRWLPARAAYVRTFHSWADIGYRAKNLDGRGHVELLSADARFAYEFTSFADSAFPIRIWVFDGGRMRDVTQLFSGQVALDAKRHWREYLKRRRDGDVRGVLAAWLADQYLLGREDEGWQAVEKASRRGDLSGPDGIWPTGPRYVRALRAFLVKLDYA